MKLHKRNMENLCLCVEVRNAEKDIRTVDVDGNRGETVMRGRGEKGERKPRDDARNPVISTTKQAVHLARR